MQIVTNQKKWLKNDAKCYKLFQIVLDCPKMLQNVPKCSKFECTSICNICNILEYSETFGTFKNYLEQFLTICNILDYFLTTSNIMWHIASIWNILEHYTVHSTHLKFFTQSWQWNEDSIIRGIVQIFLVLPWTVDYVVKFFFFFFLNVFVHYCCLYSR